MVLSWLLHYWVVRLPLFPRGLAYAVSGAALVCACALALWAHQTLNRAGTTADPRGPTTTLVTDGPFRFSRNPIYIAELLLYLSVAFFVDSVSFLPVLIPVVLVLDVGVVRREERYLEAKFGDDYRRYAARVRRWC
jgi:protein-S-isoprenylcysteine O-methyltransferase Ste14